MDEQRKQAYRYLLYEAMLDIRRLAWIPEWNRAQESGVRRAGIIADLMHNLAKYGVGDFEGFKEEWFWRDMDDEDKRNPEFGLSEYKRVFERRLPELESKGPHECPRPSQ